MTGATMKTLYRLLLLSAVCAGGAAAAPAAPAKVETCVGCHGIPGYKAVFPEVFQVPMLGGQSAQYIESALKAYRKGDRKHPSMRGVAAHYPKLGPRIEAKGASRDAKGKARELRNVEAQVNACRTERQGEAAWAWESNELLSVTAFVTYQSRNDSMKADTGGEARSHFEAGRRLYNQRMGQMNLACANCHDANWGKTLQAERISQGHPTAFPAYRLEWQTVGSLERRLRACLSGIRAEMFPYGAAELRQLSLYLSWRAQGLPIEAPGVRR